MNGSAAAAAEARMRANAMGVSELRSTLAGMGVDSRNALEKSELVTLYMLARKQPPNPTPPTQTRTVPIPASARAASPSIKIPKEVNWANAFFFAMVALFVYNNFINPSSDTPTDPSSGGEAAGPASTAFARGEVADLMTYGEFQKMLKLHEDDTNLPVVVDFFSQGCGPCRQIAPYYRALAKEMAGEVAFYKVDVNKNIGTAQQLGIRAMPTFHFYHQGKLRHRFSGADARQLEQVAQRLSLEARSQGGVFVDHAVTPRALVDFLLTRHGEFEPGASASSEATQLATKLLTEFKGRTFRLIEHLERKYKDGAPETAPRPVEGGASGGAGGGGGSLSVSSLEGVSREALETELERRLSLEDEASEDSQVLFTPPEALKGVSSLSVVIVGGGPAGLSAAIYAARAGLEPVVVAPQGGGQLLGKGVDVENYPGVAGPAATGRGIVELMRRQAVEVGARLVDEQVLKVARFHSPAEKEASLIEVVLKDPERTRLLAQSVIVATGAESRWLGVAGEWELRGGGVSSCATCDGFLHRGRAVVVVGGGDAAMEDALVLTRTSGKVTVLHRGGNFSRAAKILAQKVLNHPKIEVRWHVEVAAFVADDQKKLSAVKIRPTESAPKGPPKGTSKGAPKGTSEGAAAEKAFVLPCSGAFVAIGHDPATAFLLQGFKTQSKNETSSSDGEVPRIGGGGGGGWAGGSGGEKPDGEVLELDEGGYLSTVGTRTSIRGLFAAGDVADPTYRQAITSAGDGAKAALDVEKYLGA